MTRVLVVIAIAAGTVHAAPTLDLVTANGVDPSTRYDTDLPNSVAAGHAKARELDSCVKLVAVDYQSPGSILVHVYPKVGSDGTVTRVDSTDPNAKRKFP
ncbi:MAG TPA: hypothetical protein VGO00_25300, partial [Kofleriaceae bacterium]|nr:hypothetical protein [Kofleriaceae bacterium]